MVAEHSSNEIIYPILLCLKGSMEDWWKVTLLAISTHLKEVVPSQSHVCEFPQLDKSAKTVSHQFTLTGFGTLVL